MPGLIEGLSQRVKGIQADPRSPSLILGLAMVASAALTLWLGRDVTFSGDEVVWVTATPGIDLSTLLEPHGGHLLFLTRLAYWPILEVFGLGYLPFQLLALAAIFLAVALLFVYGRRRVGAWAALVPCLVLLFFGSDFLHLFQGNGFTVLSAMAFGVAALLSLDRDDRRGDLLACLFLVLGVISYSVALPFVVGTFVAVLIRPGRWRRMWVPLVPLAVYGFWRIWLLVADVDSEGTGLTFSNLPKLPAWAFQSVGGILNSLTGLSYNFSGLNITGQVELAGPPLALLAIFLVGLAVSRRGLSRGLLVTLVILFSLFVIQVLASGVLRASGSEARYLYPGAILVILVAFEAARGTRPSRLVTGFILLLLVAGLSTNLMLMRDNVNEVRRLGEELRTHAGAAELVRDVRPDVPAALLFGMGNGEYGDFGYDPAEIGNLGNERRMTVDQQLVSLMPVQLEPAEAPPGRCPDRRGADGSTVRFTAGPGTLSIRSRQGGPVSIGRFADGAGVPLGALSPGEWARIVIPEDSADKQWTVAYAGAELEVCVR